MSTTVYLAGAVALMAVATFLTRALPFAVFGSRPLPGVIRYLGKVLPQAIMVILVIYFLKDIDYAAWPHGLSELLAMAAVAAVHLWRKNLYLSIVLGTVVYMILIRVF